MTENDPRGAQDGENLRLPVWLIVGIAVVLTGLFVLNIIADIFVKGYSGYPTTSLLGLMIGSLIGVGRYFGFKR